MAETAPILTLSALSRRFGSVTAVDAIDLQVMEGEFFTIVGPSGSGKTTLVRMLAGMDSPSAGEIRLRGRCINALPAHRRPTCMVFQSLALFPHRSVGQNIEFPLKIRGVGTAERRRRALALMDQLRLPRACYPRRVGECSGGERQRVALARALAFDPEILFFDEPLSAIDYRLRKTLEKELKDIHRETGKTFVYITHSLEEAMVMSDRIGVMRAGRFLQVGTPREIYGAPRNRFVAEFMGEVNVLEVQLDQDRLHCPALGAHFLPPALPAGFSQGFLVVRPECLRLLEHPREAENTLQARLYNEYALGSRIQYQLRAGDKVLVVERLRERSSDVRLDQQCLLGWDRRDSIVVSE